MGGSVKRRSELFAEGLVIVVSVLLALSADAWWATQQDASRAREHLLALSRDFDQMAAALELHAAEAKRAEVSLEQRVRELTALNNLFHQHLREHVGFVGKFRALLDELSTNPRDLDSILLRAKAGPLPNVAGLLDAIPDDARDNPQA